MNKEFYNNLLNTYALAFICFVGLVFESDAEKPVPILLMLLTGVLAAIYHSEYKKMGDK
tara:strand:- start:438 stop:614 length:177 start_codon:yes stop_codon:yes gene_type:complete